MVRSCWSPTFSSYMGRPSSPTAFAVVIVFIDVAISSVGALPTGCCESLFGMSGSSMSDLAFSSERKNRTHSCGYALCLVAVFLVTDAL